MSPHSDTIEMVVEQKKEKHTEVGQDLLCTACELTVAWIGTELMQNKTKGRVTEYVNKVLFRPYTLILTNFCTIETNDLYI